jgi:ribonuclease BN (tRNA processing enzyme)
MLPILYFQLLGTRGSRPILDRDYVTFGGNTTAYKVWADGMFPIYIDGGSGLFREGYRINEEVTQFTFLLTHSHWDHILAFPFFKPFYRPATYARFWGTPSFKETFEELFQHQFQTDAFPVNYSELPAKIEFTTIMGKQTFIIPPPPQHSQDALESSLNCVYTVSTYQINHPGVDLGYRIEYAGKSIVILTDTASIVNNHLGHGMNHFTKKDEEAYCQGLIEFCWDADLMLHDTHFNEQNINGRESWGHSTEKMAVELALQGRVKRLILGHHAPEDDDQAVLKKLERAAKLAENSPLKVIIPHEDEVIEV